MEEYPLDFETARRLLRELEDISPQSEIGLSAEGVRLSRRIDALVEVLTELIVQLKEF